MKKTFTILIIVVLVHITAFAQNERRLALVIGNAEYVGKGNTLRNPVNDANDVSNRLKTLGFDVTTVLNASMLEMDDAIDAFGQKAKNYDVALFYYSGHGLQSRGENYLVPVDAELTTEASIRARCSSVNYLLDLLDESGCPMKVVCLDACRNNPFERSRGFSKGLSGIDASKGTLISFATAKGKTADDGDGNNSPYTTAFLNALDQPNLTILDFFNTVSNQVESATQEEQIPWTNYSSLKGDFCFNKKSSESLPKSKKDSTLTFNVNGVSFNMKLVEGGTFWMGAQSTNPTEQNFDSEADEDESPIHSVTLSSYYLGETEVTLSLWKAVMGNLEDNYFQNNDESQPVCAVSWDECNEFIMRLNNLTGERFRLPTEAEWEFAARGGKKNSGYKYAGSNSISSVAWYYDNSDFENHIISGLLPNELGLYDMSGNVSEWCYDLSSEYSSTPQTNPTGDSYGGYRVIRGGSRFDTAWKCRISSRDYERPYNGGGDIGFRLALSK